MLIFSQIKDNLCKIFNFRPLVTESLANELKGFKAKVSLQEKHKELMERISKAQAEKKEKDRLEGSFVHATNLRMNFIITSNNISSKFFTKVQLNSTR